MRIGKTRIVAVVKAFAHGMMLSAVWTVVVAIICVAVFGILAVGLWAIGGMVEALVGMAR